jgi:hypothetical protein
MFPQRFWNQPTNMQAEPPHASRNVSYKVRTAWDAFLVTWKLRETPSQQQECLLGQLEAPTQQPAELPK